MATSGRLAGRPHVLGLESVELAALLRRDGVAGTRLAERVFRGLHQGGAARIEELSTVSRRLRPEVARRVRDGLPREVGREAAGDGSVRFAFALEDGAVVESVLLPRHDRWTLCLSSQAGCAMACRFCATGALGLTRNLEPHEIVGQLLAVQRRHPGRIGGVVFMGMGEPLLNEAAVFKACRILGEAWGRQIGPRRIAISTVGIVPAIRRYAASTLRMPLYFSLGAAVPEKRARLMPVQERWGFDALIAAIRAYQASRGGRYVTLEYVAIRNLTLGAEDREALAERLQGLRFILNVIPWNPVPGAPELDAPSREEVKAWTGSLRSLGFPVKVRWSFGRAGAGGCGQLGARLLGGTAGGRPDAG